MYKAKWVAKLPYRIGESRVTCSRKVANIAIVESWHVVESWVAYTQRVAKNTKSTKGTYTYIYIYIERDLYMYI